MTDNILATLAEAEAIRVHGEVTARHPAASALDSLLALHAASKRYGHLLANRRRTTFSEWAALIEAAAAGRSQDQVRIAGALREMHAAAQPAPVPVNLMERLRHIGQPTTDLTV